MKGKKRPWFMNILKKKISFVVLHLDKNRGTLSQTSETQTLKLTRLKHLQPPLASKTGKPAQGAVRRHAVRAVHLFWTETRYRVCERENRFRMATI